jgi:hypothetical protein
MQISSRAVLNGDRFYYFVRPPIHNRSSHSDRNLVQQRRPELQSPSFIQFYMQIDSRIYDLVSKWQYKSKSKSKSKAKSKSKSKSKSMNY